MDDKLKYWVWLSSIQKLGSIRCQKLVDYFGEPENIWKASELDLAGAPFMTEAMVTMLMDKDTRNGADRLMEELYKYKIDVITVKGDSYPDNLKTIHDPPMTLFVKGKLKRNENIIGIVGSRMASPYGLSIAESLSAELATAGITVISGMARGIDSSAHKGCLKAGGRTVAVLGCGLDTVYPASNRYLMESIADNGAVISEFVPGTPAFPINFPARNRIISGASMGVIIVEAGEKSGSLITADFALEQGREVFAVPGNVNSQNSKGTNKLIREGAKIVTCIEDVLEELKFYKNVNIENIKLKRIKKESIFSGLDGDEKLIAGQLISEPMHIDDLAVKCGMGIKTVNSIVVMLELKGIIEQQPGKIFRLRQ